MPHYRKILSAKSAQTFSHLPDGMDALLLSSLTKAKNNITHIHIVRDEERLHNLEELIKYFAPELEVLTFPAWDCLPYDRVSPHIDILAKRLLTLSKLSSSSHNHKRVILTTINAASQRIMPPSALKNTSFHTKVGDNLDQEVLKEFLGRNGYSRVPSVMEHGDFALRGNIIDIYPTGSKAPIRIDLWGDEIDTIKYFDPLSQRSNDKIDHIHLVPTTEIILDTPSIRRFRVQYVAEFGTSRGDDPLYEAITEGRKLQGMEHWLPYFYEKMGNIFDYLPQDKNKLVVSQDHLTSSAYLDRIKSVHDYYGARLDAYKSSPKGAAGSSAYKPLPHELLYIGAQEWQDLGKKYQIHKFTAHESSVNDISFSGTVSRNFSLERNDAKLNIYDELKKHITNLQKSGKKTLIASYSEGSRDRLSIVMKDHGMKHFQMIEKWSEVKKLNPAVIGLIILPLEHGFNTDDFAIISEQDILGDRLIRKVKRSRRAENFINSAAELNPDDLVIHIDHGVGRYVGFKTIIVNGAKHDCVHLVYHGGDKLYLPVVNIEVLSRFGGTKSDASLDKLGGVAWQARKAKLKKRIREMADELIKVAAARALKKGEIIEPPEGAYDEFCARFPYTETDDQLRCVEDIIKDLRSGQPMDRLICGDVGFGKTEVALRATFLASMSGLQVAIVAPTTLLARQHYKSFTDRFKGLPLRIGHLSRLVKAKEQKQTREEMEKGTIDIVVGTHALLSKSIKFRNLGMLIIDEEQHFGVAHKERLKKIKNNVHVLTLTATPIPRTLQMAMSGMRGLSLIATPPVDRLAVRTFVMPQDSLVIREALLREHYRGGQSFYVCPRVSDLKGIYDFLKEHVPEVKVVKAHGQMPPSELEDVMNAFYDGAFDVLLSTTIVESGLDIPTANTMIIHRADMFGLSQLYQLRGRVGRAKVRAYAYLTLSPKRIPTKQALKRLEVLQTLDNLGAGFTLASHDMDIRGAGNLLGDEQSGHIKEVGIELYQQMLEEAVAEARSGAEEEEESTLWSPQINVGASVMIPEHYVTDINLRMSLYRRLADLEDKLGIDAFAAELIDRFGKLPEEVEHLLLITEIKHHCRAASIERIETGVKGAILTFKNNKFKNPAGLIDFISRQGKIIKIRSDHKLVYSRNWQKIDSRLKGTLNIAKALGKIAHK